MNGSKNASIGLYAPIAIPSGTRMTAAMTKPPPTRQMVTPISLMKPCWARRFQPSRSIAAGSARKVGETKPPKVASAHAATNSTKKATPSATRAPGPTGFKGVNWLLDVARVDRARDVGHRLDDAHLEQQLAGFPEESLQLAGEEILIRRPILPAQVRGRLRELLAALLHVRAHDLISLLRLLDDHLERLEVAFGHRLGGLGVLRQEFRRAAEGVHHHRIVEGGGDDLARVGLRAHRREVGLVGHHRVVLPGEEGLRRRTRIDRDHRYVLRREAVLLQHPRH